MSMVTGVDFSVIPVKDFERAVAFYGETLGLPLSTRYGKMNGVEFETGNLTLAVLDAGEFGIDFTPAKNAIALRVEDVAAARKELESKGVEFQGEIVDTGVCHQTYFSDPDGHALILHHRYAPR
jgi:catechol 2,3-dioxygenase-like lactoylglutathione lyase family enzyme